MNKIQRIIIKLKCIQWKAWMTIFTIVCSVGVLGITKCTYEMKTWIELVVIPMLISFLMGVGVSCWFTYRSDSSQFDMNLEIELDTLARRLLEDLTHATFIASNPFFDAKEKIRQLRACLVVNHANTYYIEVECNDICLEYYEILKKDEKFIQKLPLVDDNIKFAKVFNDNINEIAEAHHILLEKTLKEREIVFQRRRKKEKWVYRNNRVQQNDVR